MTYSKTAIVVVVSALTIATFGMFFVMFQKLNDLETTIVSELSSEQDNPGETTSPVPVKTANSPSKGNEDASVTLVEFSDFQCPFCKEIQPVVQDVFEKHSEDIQYVYRNFPLSEIHPEAFNAALASLCADEQGKFWQYHDRLFEKATEEVQPTKEVLEATASEIELNRSNFDKCLATEKYSEQVKNDIQDGTSYGVEGTPTFFVNDRMVSGIQTFDEFDRIIKEELAK